ncbi:Serine/arginine-rich splicing factor 2 [Papilio xuthus]|uniref:Serine/arginine-rich splicing factor 2 n=1 Tax=Papilio xuthus TaxID=66420 RepID=A0A194QB33_PAPXU|nr:Serine/arginine-rich splicing factor 2 [Papilio xuthus]
MSYGRPPPRIDGMVSLKVDNLTYRTTAEDLRRVFERCGDVGDIYIPRDRYTRESRGFAFVRFFDRRDAEDALDSLDGRMLDGRELRVQMARYGRPSSPYRSRYDRRRSIKSAKHFRTYRVLGLVHVVDPGPVRGRSGAPTRAAAPVPALGPTRRAPADAPVAAAVPARAPAIEVLGRGVCWESERFAGGGVLLIADNC